MVPSPAAESSAGNSPFSNSQSTTDIFKVDQKPTLAPMEQTAAERLASLMRDSGYSPDRLQNMYDELPPRKMRDELVDHYFDAMSVLTSWTSAFGLLTLGLVATGLATRYRNTSSGPPMPLS